MKIVQYQQPNYQQVPGTMEPIPIREFRGLNLFDPLSIDESFFTEVVNMDSTDFPALQTRQGYTVDYSEDTTGSIGVKGMTTFRLPTGEEELHVIFEGKGWRAKLGNNWRALPFSQSGQSMSYEFATAFVPDSNSINPGVEQVALFMQNGGGKTYMYTQGQGTYVVDDLPDTARFITSYQNRLWCVVDNELWASKLDQPTEWEVVTAEGESAAYRRQIETRNGEPASVLDGSFTRLFIGSPNMTQELYGGVPSQFNVQPISGDIGPINMKSTVTLDGIMYFINKNGIYQYAGGTLPDKDFAEVINDLIQNVGSSSNSNYDSLRISGGTDGEKVYFFVNEKFIVYDPRPGINTWTTYEGISAHHFAVFQNKLYIGDRQGRVLKIGGNTDNGTAINWRVTTKALSVNAISRKQRWYKLWIAAELNGTMKVEMSETVDGNDWVEVGTMVGSGEGVRRFIVPVDKFALSNYIRLRISGTGFCKLHEITRYQRQLPLY